jgi:hypothetical protein
MTYQGYEAVMFLLNVYMADEAQDINVFSAKRTRDGMPVVMFCVGDDRAVLSVRQVRYLPTCCELVLDRASVDEPDLRAALENIATLALRTQRVLDGVSPYGAH